MIDFGDRTGTGTRWFMALCALAWFVGCQRAPVVPPREAPTVTIAKPLAKSIVEWDEYVGRLEAISTVEIRPRIEGYLASSHFDEGQLVKAGDLLFVIDQRPYQARLGQAQANLQSARAQLASSQASQTGAQAAQSEAAAQLTLAKDRFQRAEQLRRTNNISDEEFQQRVSENQQAQAVASRAEANLAASAASIEGAAASIETAQAQVRTAEIELGYTQIRAPIAGRVSRRLVTPGNLIASGPAGSTLLTTIVSLDPIHAYFEADESKFLKYMRLSNSGDRPSSRDFKNPAFLALGDEQGFPHAGHMDFVDNRLDRQTGTIMGRAIFSNADNDLTPGLFARIRIPASASHAALLLPDEAISSDQTSRVVLVIDAEGQVAARRVELGPLVNGLRVIRQGIAAEDRVIIRGHATAFPGTKPKLETMTIEESASDGMPDQVEPWPKERWLSAGFERDVNLDDPSGGSSAAAPTPPGDAPTTVPATAGDRP